MATVSDLTPPRRSLIVSAKDLTEPELSIPPGHQPKGQATMSVFLIF